MTPREALRRLLDATKQIDFADCKDERVWQAIGAAQGTAEGVLRDGVEPDASSEYVKSLDDAFRFGTGFMLGGKHVPYADVFAIPLTPVAGQPSAVAAGDWEDRLYAALDAEFELRDSDKRDADGQRIGLRVDDTQIGVEFAMKWFKSNMLSAAPSIAAPTEVERVKALQVARAALKTADYAIKGREHTGFINNAIAIIDAAIATGEKA